MTIKLLEGDIFSFTNAVLVVPVNTVGAMGSGLAYPFRERYPLMYNRYQAHCRSGKFKIGNLWLCTAYRDVEILCFPTKEDWRDPARLYYVKMGLEKFVREHKRFLGKTVVFPPLGCGHGGLAEADVIPIMQRVLKPISHRVNIIILTKWRRA